MLNETLKVIKNRRNVRGYKSDKVPDELLNAVLEAGLSTVAAILLSGVLLQQFVRLLKPSVSKIVN